MTENLIDPTEVFTPEQLTRLSAVVAVRGGDPKHMSRLECGETLALADYIISGRVNYSLVAEAIGDVTSIRGLLPEGGLAALREQLTGNPEPVAWETVDEDPAESVAEHIERTATITFDSLPRFAVGDTVRILGATINPFDPDTAPEGYLWDHETLPVGAVGVVEKDEFDLDQTYLVRSGEETEYVFAYDLKKVEVEPEPVTFDADDRVVVTSAPYCSNLAGRRFLISEFGIGAKGAVAAGPDSDGDYRVNIDGDRQFYINAACLAPAGEEPVQVEEPEQVFMEYGDYLAALRTGDARDGYTLEHLGAGAGDGRGIHSGRDSENTRWVGLKGIDLDGFKPVELPEPDYAFGNITFDDDLRCTDHLTCKDVVACLPGYHAHEIVNPGAFVPVERELRTGDRVVTLEGAQSCGKDLPVGAKGTVKEANFQGGVNTSWVEWDKGQDFPSGWNLPNNSHLSVLVTE